MHVATLDITECTSTSLHICNGSMINKLIGIGDIAGKPSWMIIPVVLTPVSRIGRFPIFVKTNLFPHRRERLYLLLKKSFFKIGAAGKRARCFVESNTMNGLIYGLF